MVSIPRQAATASHYALPKNRQRLFRVTPNDVHNWLKQSFFETTCLKYDGVEEMGTGMFLRLGDSRWT